MIFRSLCRDAGIGANCYAIEAVGARVVLDCGMHPKQEAGEALPRLDLLEDDSVDAVVITHAHLDHIGTLPVLMERQSGARIFASAAGMELGMAMLHNSVNVMQSKRVELGIPEYPFFSHRQLDDMQRLVEVRGNERPFGLDHADALRATFHDAGHVLGSVAVTVDSGDHKLLYTGDVNFEDSSLIKGALLPETPVDTLVIETTRGAAPRRAGYTRDEEEREFAEALAETLRRGGSALVPVFAMGKTQEVLTMIHKFKLRGWLPKTAPVVMGGLSTKMTMIYDHYNGGLTRRHDDEFCILKDMEVQLGRRNKAIVPKPGAIFCLSSGMIMEHTASYRFLKAGFLENPKNGLFFVGYADPDSPAGKIRAAKHGALLKLGEEKHVTRLNAELRVFDFSGHAVREDLLAYILKLKPRNVVLVHGDAPARQWFADQLAERAADMRVIMPGPGEEYDLQARTV